MAPEEEEFNCVFLALGATVGTRSERVLVVRFQYWSLPQYKYLAQQCCGVNAITTE